MMKGDAWFWIIVSVAVGACLVTPYLRRRSDWVNWAIVAGGVAAIVVVLVVFPLR
jgi:hypothetical protein